MKLESIIVGPLAVNCYIISKDGKAVIVDPGGNTESIVKYLKQGKLTPVAIVNTHGHFDHIGSVSQLKEAYDIPFMLHKDDEFLCSHGAESSAMFGFDKIENPAITDYLTDGQQLSLGGIEIGVIHTPGHSPGGVCLYVRELKSVMTGDTLFLESVGRSDFPYASTEQLMHSIREKVFSLPDETKVFPGHGPSSSIGHEKKFNPFL
ncbi:beta-lactamase domain protein [Denitrovibrio acetiphilus DSM 12809]|uniref:Beta-lactamase domain protein n=1 Tax=Denitrovibrio acetiphilus (strain DSM 12809 / NBRC 114555 / N2460) TaxID=522772 RepID=D4H867_DENA2|nr:MBL fold metallo-hydrolase [Denitrovibrio acetiphilus]ADD68216.1 beta-lactamase domain protein [Denitrovibrio acetiphilus DSM 12809]